MIDFRSLNLLTAGSQVEKLQKIMILGKRISIAPDGMQDQRSLSKLPVGEVDLRDLREILRDLSREILGGCQDFQPTMTLTIVIEVLLLEIAEALGKKTKEEVDQDQITKLQEDLIRVENQV